MTVDRAAAVRTALVRLVAARGFHGASMAAVAQEAGVATGTAYVHYPSKAALVQATHLEVKRDLLAAAVSRVTPDLPARARFEQLWDGALDHLSQEPDRARFLLQYEASPFAKESARATPVDVDESWLAPTALADLVALFVALPLPVLFDLAVGPLIHIVATEGSVDPQIRDTLVEACWRAVTA